MRSIKYLYYLSYFLLNYVVMSDNEYLNDDKSEARASDKEGLVWLCLDSTPDGAALIVNPSDDEIMVLFKVDTFWTIRVDQVRDFVSNKGGPLLVSTNSSYALNTWPKFPTSLSNAMSFTGLNRSDAFFNNVFVFRATSLYRYSVDQIEDDTIKSVSLLGVYETLHWYEDPSSALLIAPRGSKLLSVTSFSSLYPFVSSWGGAFVISATNFENPIRYDIAKPAFIWDFSQGIRFILDIGHDEPLIIQTNGFLCIGGICRTFLAPGICAFIDGFKSSFGFWLWYNTTFTFRLLMTSLLGVMFINFTIALAFLWNQVKMMASMA